MTIFEMHNLEGRLFANNIRMDHSSVELQENVLTLKSKKKEEKKNTWKKISKAHPNKIGICDLPQTPNCACSVHQDPPGIKDTSQLCADFRVYAMVWFSCIFTFFFSGFVHFGFLGNGIIAPVLNSDPYCRCSYLWAAGGKAGIIGLV